MKRNFKSILVLGIVAILITSVCGLAVSRHTQATAVSRWNVTVPEGTAITRLVLCYDPDGDTPVTMVEDTLPAGATLGPVIAQAAGFTDPGMAELPAANAEAKWYTREFKWTPSYTQAGTYSFYINAKDPSGDDDWAKYTITVTNSNRPPVL